MASRSISAKTNGLSNLTSSAY